MQLQHSSVSDISLEIEHRPMANPLAQLVHMSVLRLHACYASAHIPMQCLASYQHCMSRIYYETMCQLLVCTKGDIVLLAGQSS